MYQLLVSGGVIGLFLQVVPVTCLVGVVYAAYRCIHIKQQKISVEWSAEILRWLFVCYLTGLINLTLVPRNLWLNIWALIYIGYSGNRIELFNGSFNFTPIIFRIIAGEISFGSWIKTMLIGNLLMMMPMGAFLPFISSKINAKSILKIAVIIPVVIEIIQPVMGRSFDIDDLILNFIGIVIGYLMAVGIKDLFCKRRSKGA